MYINSQFKIKNNPKYIEYLHHNSYWYKNLNRNSNNFKLFEEDYKNNIKNNLSNKINEVAGAIDMITTFLSQMK